MQNQQPPTGEKAYVQLMIIWFAMLVAQFIFLLVIFLVKPEVLQFDFNKPLLGNEPVIVIILALIGLINFILSIYLSRKYINQAIEKQNPLLVQTGMIIGCALAESISLFGFVLAFAFDYQYFFLWFGLGILGVVLNFPKRENFQSASYKNIQKF